MNYFELLGLPQSFDLDLKQLESAYFNAQRQYHPDRFVSKTPEERAQAALISANLNDAYQTLKHPLKRAWHMLALHGIEESEGAKPDLALLGEIMELREAIAEGQKPNILQLINACEATLSQAFKNNDFESAKNSTIRLSYLTKLGLHHH